MSLEANNTMTLGYASFVVSIGVVIILIAGIIYYYLRKTGEVSRKCGSFDTQSAISSVTRGSDTYVLRDYYVQCAYNACAIYKNKNSFVDLCAVQNALRQGARGLDFEIYSINGEPVVATSCLSTYNIKQTFNYLKLTDVLSYLHSNAFSTMCPNSYDPLILHFRVKSEKNGILDSIASAITTNLKDRLLPPKFSEAKENLGEVPLPLLREKVIIAVDTTPTDIKSSDLWELTNISPSTGFVRVLRNYDVEFNQDPNELKAYNRYNMTITLPDITCGYANPNALIHMQSGCQFIFMAFQNADTNLEAYTNVFTTANKAFVLKKASLRYIEKAVPKAPAQDHRLSYAPRNTPVGNGALTFTF